MAHPNAQSTTFSTTSSPSASTPAPAVFEELPKDAVVQEEGVPGYRPDEYYPVTLGEVLNDRYRVVAKLGYGVGSTVWLCRDLGKGNADADEFLTVKVCTAQTASELDAQAEKEIATAEYLATIEGEHPGRNYIRLVWDHFSISSSYGTTHRCLVYKPMGMNLTDLRNMFPEKSLAMPLFKQTVKIILIGLDFLHQAGLVHTDVSPNNILLGIHDPSLLLEIEQAEIIDPAPRKILPGRTIYYARGTPLTHGPPVISDFGMARIGDSHRGDIMPDIYRAPEVILDMEWSYSVDIWAVGVMLWDLFEGTSLFSARKKGMLDNELHLAEMVSLMGPPPPSFLARSEACKKYWDEHGNWIASTPIPDQSIWTCEEKLDGEEKELFIKFARRMLCWLPEERASATDLLWDDFLRKP